MAPLPTRLLLNLMVNESAMLVKVRGRYLLLRRGSVFRLEFVTEAVVAELLSSNLVAPTIDEDWDWEGLVPTAEGRRMVKREAPDDA